jgi:NADH-quinone oxidoreductase subunit F
MPGSLISWKLPLPKQKNGWLGKNILRFRDLIVKYMYNAVQVPISAEKKPHCFESLEGKSGNPRIKPPFPAVKGLWDCPTVVNNVETIAAVVPIINEGGEEYAKIGVGKIYRHKIDLCLWQYQ